MSTKAIGWTLAVVLFAACLWLAYHDGYSHGIADAATSAAHAKDANDASQATIAQLRQSVTACEDGRKADQAAQAAALAQRQTQLSAIDSAYATARAQLDQRMKTECETWATQPACGSVP